MDFPFHTDADVDAINNNFLFRFDATEEMQNATVDNSMHIKEIAIDNPCNRKDEHIRCFNFFTRIIQGIIGNGKHLRYASYNGSHEFNLEQANQLADALRTNNNNNNAIESFHFDDCTLTPVTFQLLWDPLLAIGVREITFLNYNRASPYYHHDNNNINFMGMEANTSLKELDLKWYNMREEDYQSLFISMKVNKGVKILTLPYIDLFSKKRITRLFKEMMRENITLLDCRTGNNDEDRYRIFKMINFHTELNRMWNRYMMKRNADSTAVVATTGAAATDTKVETNKKKEIQNASIVVPIYS